MIAAVFSRYNVPTACFPSLLCDILGARGSPPRWRRIARPSMATKRSGAYSNTTETTERRGASAKRYSRRPPARSFGRVALALGGRPLNGPRFNLVTSSGGRGTVGRLRGGSRVPSAARRQWGGFRRAQRRVFVGEHQGRGRTHSQIESESRSCGAVEVLYGQSSDHVTAIVVT